MNPAYTGVQFTNTLSTLILINKNLLNGSGVALGDYDNDGRCDIYPCRLDGSNVMYNLGNWKFRTPLPPPARRVPQFSVGRRLRMSMETAISTCSYGYGAA